MLKLTPSTLILCRDSFDEETKLSKRAIELNQGRAAQMGILALMVHEQLGVSLIPN
jgi:Chlorophyll A-B binding protein